MLSCVTEVILVFGSDMLLIGGIFAIIGGRGLFLLVFLYVSVVMYGCVLALWYWLNLLEY